MIRRLSTSLSAVCGVVMLMSVMGFGQPQSLLTRHIPEAAREGRVPMVGHLPANQSMRLVLVLPHRNQAELDNFLKEVYEPSSPLFRKFLTVDEFTQRFGPSRDDYNAVIQFAKNNGLTVVKTSRNRMNIDVTGSVANIEKALNVRMAVYQHDTENRTFFSPDREPTPDTIQLWHIAGLDNYATPKAAFKKVDSSVASQARSNATTGSGPSASFLGSDMRAAYYINGSSSATLTGSGQSLGLFEFIGTDIVDLNTYYTNVGQTNTVPITLTSVDTQSTLCAEPTCDDTEQTLDMTQALGMAPGMAGLTMWIGTGGLSGQTLDDPGILNGMVTASPLQAQLSCSWMWKPTDNTTDDVYFQEMGAQGQNFFVAVGDDGKWTSGGFHWPADDLYITGVGGTDLDTASAAGPWASETGWSDTGGGIGPDDFAIPSWQVTAAAGCAKCSQSFRNGPDVSANANFTFYVCADQTKCTANNYGGTSFATPMWAGYLALANEQYLSGGATSTLGFINPAIYAIAEGPNYALDFHDITSGGNSDGSTVGFDLSTGWGSPNGANLINDLAPVSASFAMSATPKGVSVAQGSHGTATIKTTATGGFDSAITLSAKGQPAGVTVGFSPKTITGTGHSSMAIKVSATTKAGSYVITITGTGGGVTQTTTVTLRVTT